MKVVLENLTKIFPSRNKKAGEEVIAVNNFSFEIPDGKLIGLLGPSGCGKSTTLYMISGLQKPTSGKIYFGDDDITAVSPENRDSTVLRSSRSQVQDRAAEYMDRALSGRLWASSMRKT